MRAASLALIALLVFPGCAMLAIAPAGGAVTGVAIAAARSTNDSDISYANHVIAGTLAGVVVDAIMIFVIINELKDVDFEIRQLPPLPGR